jgi:uncharacterized RDD family membrane protein YckC
MHERPHASDPNALTQAIPVVQVAPPPRPTGVRPAVARPDVARIGNLPWYLFARFAAFAFDILGVAFVVATFGFHAIAGGLFLFAGTGATAFATLAGSSLGIAIAVAYVSEALFGTTLGKLVFGLQVRRRQGGRAGGGRVLVRTLLRPIDLLAIGPLLALVTPRHQRLGDMLAGTIVVGNRLGAVASLLGLILAGALAYAQITFGGGLTSAIGVAAETSDYAPSVYAWVSTALHMAAPHPRTDAPSPANASSGTSNS